MNSFKDIKQQHLLYESNKIIDTLSKYKEIIVNDDKTVTYLEKRTDYFLDNFEWSMSFFYDIQQFKNEIPNNILNKYIVFFFEKRKNLNNELKFVVYHKIFSSEWSFTSIISFHNRHLELIVDFIDEKYPNINSFQELNLKKANLEWVEWLNNKNISTTYNKKYIDKDHFEKKNSSNYTSKYLDNFVNTLYKLLDEREEWEKDRWDIRNLAKKYDISYSKTNKSNYIDFSKINNEAIKKQVMAYIKERLITKNRFGWGSACLYMSYLPVFLNFICNLERTWNDLKNLQRSHILKYIEWLNLYANSPNNRVTNPNKYIRQVMIIIETFLEDIQGREYDIAPIKPVRALIYPEDKPTFMKQSADVIQYVPDCVLEQLFENIDKLPTYIGVIVYIMFKTGLRISDTLELTQDCLLKLNDAYWIKTDIEKTYVKDHKIPIDNDLAMLIAVLIERSVENSNEDNNPNKYIFVKYKGRRKGQTYTRKHIQQRLNKLAIENNMVDENNQVYHFKNHAFRHTYAIKLLNSGVDIVTVQELMAHASPEMTMKYAKLLDDTKRKAFDEVIKKGVFSFDDESNLNEENNGEIPENILDMLYTNHKLNALDTPYGTCMQRKKGKCNFAKQPPCLTCNNGNPCKDLCIGAFEGDSKKYEILIQSTKSLIDNAKIYNRIEMVEENSELLKLYEDIYSKIIQGNMIYSRLDKLKKEGEICEQ